MLSDEIVGGLVDWLTDCWTKIVRHHWTSLQAYRRAVDGMDGVKGRSDETN